MKKIFFNLILSLAVLFTFNSCTTAAFAQYQDDLYYSQMDLGIQSGETYTTIITLGTPFYYNGVISYYYYNGLYYYPYFWDNCWYFQPFRHVFEPGYIFYPPRNHFRPQIGLGDRENRHPHNFGNRNENQRPHNYGNRGQNNDINNRQGFSTRTQPQTRTESGVRSSTRMGSNNQQRTQTQRTQTQRVQPQTRNSGTFSGTRGSQTNRGGGFNNGSRGGNSGSGMSRGSAGGSRGGRR